ncbi:cytochrome c maturation protein CcmE [Gallionella capsiferriformans]|uniref:Cytochrome c-type biogenesis protein CcmE n=1 Tax=Gallionella capsiferriformans (strain ES-2) TaxID=395494 RepID=D9SGY3_GALCS|nr:cytochrome c maturation protein CcmE [Gallionella capsiferriformans]ADL55780.1 CcmE/CycJ protein [Gallionella capsiferriformans ES-2]
MKPRQKRILYIVLAIAAVGLAVGLVLNALKDNVSLYFTPTQVYNKEAPQGRSFRIGGLVEEGSIERQKDGLTVHFMITDLKQKLPVVYKGILPDLFKEGKGVVAQGKMEADGVMHASEVLAKHDENYMPPEAADALKRAEAASAVSAPATK